MYIALMLIPVAEDKMDAYREWAAFSAGIFKQYGCLEIVDGWDDLVPRGKTTDMYRAVAAEEGEKIVFSWQIWPDKDFFYAAEQKMHDDGVLDTGDPPPFDGNRLIVGCFEPVYSMGRNAG